MKKQNREPDQGLMTPAELAIYLCVSRRTVQRLTSSGQIPLVRVGALVRYDVGEVVAALADKECKHA